MKRAVAIAWLLALGAALWAPAQAASCTAEVSRGLLEGEMRFGVLERTYRLYVPPGWDNRKPGALVIGLHGGYGSGKIFAEQTGAMAAAERHNMLLLLPDGFKTSWNAGSCCKPAARFNVNDVGFISALVERVSGEYCVDPAQVFATGFSNGAMLAHRLACERPELLAAIAPVSGGIMLESCAAKTPVASLMIQGRDDPRIFWDGGEFDGSYRPAMRELAEVLARRNACGPEQALPAKSGGVLQCYERKDCAGAPLRYCAVQGVGHQWPGGKTYWADKLGANTRAFDATAEIFQFFDELTR